MLFGGRSKPRTVIQRRALVLAVLLVLAGCAMPTAEDGPPATPDEVSGAAIPDGSEYNYSDPDSDRLGWEAGYWHDESVAVNQSDGLNETEREAFVARSMARVEYIRQKEFTKTVPVSVLSREEYADQTRAGVANASTSGAGANFSAWNNQVWEAMFVTGEHDDSQQAIGETRSSSVAGFYSSRADEIKIITDTPERPVINNATLLHELVHALQDQHYDLTDPRYAGRTQDSQLAIDGLIEGSAMYVEKRYAYRCGSEWACVATPPRRQNGGGAGGSGSAPNWGVLLTVYQPYSDGAAYVASHLERGGWAAIDRLHANPPESSEQTIHAVDERPTPINYTDAARNGWRLFPEQGSNGSDTLGEASMYVMFWNQARERNADTVDPRAFFRGSGPYDVYDYGAQPSAGWANDRLFPYRNAGSGETEYGYVWVTEWDTERDAREFRETYGNILSAHDAVRRDGVRVIEDGAFADAFRVVRRGDRVIIVNGPTPDDVNDIRPGLTNTSNG